MKFLSKFCFKLKIPFDEASTLNYLTQEEKLDNSAVDNFFGITPRIISTNDLSESYKGKIKTLPKTKVFKSSKINLVWTALLGLFVITLGTIFWIKSEAGSASSLFSPLLILVVSIGLIKQLFSRQINFNILLTEEGITIKDIFYPWASIYKIYFILKSRNKSQLYYLVLALDTGLTDKYDVTALIDMINTEAKIAAYIDSYKNFT